MWKVRSESRPQENSPVGLAKNRPPNEAGFVMTLLMHPQSHPARFDEHTYVKNGGFSGGRVENYQNVLESRLSLWYPGFRI